MLIEPNGSVIKTRSFYGRTGHTRSQAINLSSIAVALSGDFNIEEPTKEQVKSLKRIINNLEIVYNVDVIGHKQASPTSCPGKNLMRIINNLT